MSRREDCINYSVCLDAAAKANLKDVWCKGCPRYHKEETDYTVAYKCSDRHVYPAAPEVAGSMPELSALLSQQMKRMGIPTGDWKPDIDADVFFGRAKKGEK